MWKVMVRTEHNQYEWKSSENSYTLYDEEKNSIQERYPDNLSYVKLLNLELLPLSPPPTLSTLHSTRLIHYVKVSCIVWG